MAREAYITVVVGRQGGGKTYRQVQECIEYGKRKKVLVFDCNVRSGSYKQFTTIDYDCSISDDWKHGKVINDKSAIRCAEIKKWTGAGHRRVVNFNKKTQDEMGIDEMNATCIDLMKHFTDGMLVLEDTNGYLYGAKQKNFISAFVRGRHRNADLVLIFQSCGALDPRIWGNMSLMRMHKTLDSVMTPSIRNRIPSDKFEMIMLAELMINEQYDIGNIYFLLYLEFRKYKIIGANEQLLARACVKYLNMFPSELKFFMAQNEMTDRSVAIKSWTQKCKMRYL